MNSQLCIRYMCLTVKRVVELLTVYPDRLWCNRPVLSHIKVSYRSQLFQEFPELEEKDIRQAPEPMRLPGRDKVRTLRLS